MERIPDRQYAVQLVGPDQLILNKSKDVFKPGQHQVLAQVEVVGLCFSDLKLLKQFTGHVRKGPVVSGVDLDILKEIPSYVPDAAPTVPGHETVVRVVAVGPGVERHKPGERYLVQTDYRWVHTASSNSAFGYNFEGALQEYVLMDERIITAPDGESMLIPAGEERAGSAIALCEPWACVEDAYVTKERTTLKAGGRMLIVADIGIPNGRMNNLYRKYGTPAKVTWVSKSIPPTDLGSTVVHVKSIFDLEDAAYDDVIYFGANARTVEQLFPKVAANGLFNIVLEGERFGKPVVTMVGRVHYGGIRIIGTTTTDPAESMKYIPKTGEIRHDEIVNVVGAGGPMGMMHVIRNVCQGVPGVTVYAGDVDDNRLAALSQIVAPLAEKNGVEYKPYNASNEQMELDYTYTVLMAPVPELVATAVHCAAPRGIVNIFAGIPATVTGQIDLDAYIEKRLYFIGTSGSTLDDMKRMLEKVESDRLDTNVSVAAICGFEGAVEGIRAVENRSIAGKIMVYPACRSLGLIRLEDLPQKMPDVAACLKNGLWTREAEKTLLEKYAD
ncbi:MAG TPA: alcohol dehydrogenase catalytic domain-containing protein [Sedimentisphaerales bacterium]|jgi:threonine dehydrogenase-like Zn-dependent dehydrogenase|nr:alcohol dehydrogenase catalytic domain-containing protein [Sedimentisphaerales bacterium]HNU30102.1 alcohol dehydrogenase catalytic domain-containing protein [Sedimentisphaerales bacterium]